MQEKRLFIDKINNQQTEMGKGIDAVDKLGRERNKQSFNQRFKDRSELKIIKHFLDAFFKAWPPNRDRQI